MRADLLMTVDARADELERRCAQLTEALAETALECHRRGQELDRWRDFARRLYGDMADRGKQLRNIRDSYDGVQA
jgi:hypothetical protein